MKVQEQAINFSFEALYHQLGRPSDAVTELWYVLHGYGQRSEYFVRKFAPIAQENRLIVAPGGLSRFYLKGFSGRVGSTWMTREHRELDIQNYLNYLDAIDKKVRAQLPNLKKVVLLGFSQGGATASRWLMRLSPVDHFLLWAGVFPPDLDMSSARNRLKGLDTHFIYGKQDPFISNERLEELQALSKDIGVQPQVHTFEGEHDIHAPLLKTIAEKL